MGPVADLIPWIRAAVQLLHEASLPAAAEQLDGVARTAYTTSSEMIGEIGLTILDVQSQLNQRPAIRAAASLELCLAEVRKVYPSIGET